MEEFLESLLKSAGLDKYERDARLKPAILSVLPAIAMAAIWSPFEWSWGTGLFLFFSSCGIIALLMNLTRFQGRKVEKKLIAQQGGLTTTLMLRHSDNSISAPTKARYSNFFKSHGFTMPSLSEELSDPVGADAIYKSVTDWLRQKTFSPKDFPYLKGENISYGFRRNLLGLKPIGLFIALASLGVNTYALYYYWADSEIVMVATALETLLVLIVAVWVIFIHMPFVEDVARAYALRLFAECDNLPKGSH